MELRYGQMAASTLANGRIIKLMEKEYYITQMVISTRVNGPTIKLMAMVPILIRMELNTSDNGKTISKMGLELSNGWMAKDTKGNIEMEPKQAQEF
jgi:uncharacterized paraquat-inducible protein A